MFKKSLILGIVAGILSGVACIVFSLVYKETMMTDFSPVIKSSSLISACIFGCVLASIGYWGLTKVLPKSGEIIFNLLFTLLSFISILGPIAYTFPPELDVEGIDMITSYFIPFAMTLHFFPALVWFTLKPLFIKR